MKSPKVPILEAIEDVSSGNRKIPQRDYRAHGSIPIVDQGAPLIGGFTDDESARHGSSSPVIIFGDHTKIFKYIDFPFAMGADGVKVLKTRVGWDSRYVHHYLRSLDLPDVGYSRHFKFLKAELIPRPPLDEQQRIASLLSYADSINQNLKSKAALLESLNLAAFNKLFAHCERTVSLGSIAKLGSGGTPSKRAIELWEGRTPWFSAKDLKSTYLQDSITHVADNIAEKTSLKLLPPMTNAVVVRGMILAHTIPVSILEPPATINQDLKAILPTEDISSEFLNAAIKNRTDWLLARVTTASHGTMKLDTDTLTSMPVPYPTAGENDQFTNFAKSIQNQLSLTDNVKRKHRSLLEALRCRAFRGEL